MADNWQLKAVISANASGMLAALKSVNQATKGTRKYLADVATSAGNVGTRLGIPLGLLSGVAGGFSMLAIKNAMVGLADLEDQTSKFAATTGIAASEFKRFQYLAKLSNVPFEALTGSMGKLNNTIYAAATGKNKDVAALFKKLGIQTRDANGQLRSAADLLPELADGFERNTNPVVRARMGMALFGKSWQEIMPLLADGSSKINERMERFRELGLEVKETKAFEAQMKAAGLFGDRMDDVSFVLKGFQNTIAASLIPVLEPLLNSFVKWVAINRDLVAIEVKAFVTDMANALRGIDWVAFVQGTRSFFSGLKDLIDMVGGAKNALIGLVVFMNLSGILAFFSMVGAVGKFIWSLGVLAAGAIPAALAGLRSLSLAMLISGGGVGGLTKSVGGLLGKLGLLATAFTLAYELGTLLYDKFISGTNFGDALGGGIAKTMAFFGNEEAKQSVAANERTSLVAPPKAGRVDGSIDININGLPAGSRVEQDSKGNMPMNLDVGMRSYAYGAP
jgi:hypothetical protein